MAANASDAQLTGGRAGYLPVSEHGLIGDLHCVALVGNQRHHRLALPPVVRRSQRVRLAPGRKPRRELELAAAVPAKTRQFYLPDTNVLITRFFAEDGVGEIQDFMPVGGGEAQRHRLIRRVLCVRGSMPFRARVSPRFDYGMQPHTLTDVRPGWSSPHPARPLA